MCELLGMVSNAPIDLTFSFAGLTLRGGMTGPHADGWGLSLYDGTYARTFLEPGIVGTAPAWAKGPGSGTSIAFVGRGPEGEGIYVVKVNKIIPGNALTRPTLITQTQQGMQNSLSQEYGAQFLNAMRQTVGVKRNEKAIASTKQRITGSGG